MHTMKNIFQFIGLVLVIILIVAKTPNNMNIQVKTQLHAGNLTAFNDPDEWITLKISHNSGDTISAVIFHQKDIPVIISALERFAESCQLPTINTYESLSMLPGRLLASMAYRMNGNELPPVEGKEGIIKFIITKLNQ
jgi:hypothetical protein